MFVHCYRNLETGQTFYSNEELLHYVHYATRILPLINVGKLTFKDFIKMPSEGSKGKAAAENSSVSATPADGMPQDHPKVTDKGKRKAEGRGRCGKK
ncbi:uncharacterized protein LOC132300569 isoform X2 [Cornus florida]|uniref:uncharacterized protein LOC132300569 isoform X2 n=1 Tax=Cornus florida TaxID=4283 RepID=UPI00289DEF5C|nr:uncharacterized protein LOC132300569 isoform X2 [Cornus florida]